MPPSSSFRSLLDSVREVCLAAFAHQDLPFERLVEEVRPERQVGRQPLFRVLFAVQNFPLEVQRLPSLVLRPVELETGASHFDLSLFVQRREDGMHLAVRGDSDLFDPTTLDRLAGHLRVLAAAVVADPAAPVSSLPLLSPAELHQVRHEWAAAPPLPGAPPAVLTALAEVTRRRPDATALRYRGEALSFGELEGAAEALAARLRQAGVGPGHRVALLLPRDPRLPLAILAVLRCGAAYLPLDPAIADERLAYVLEDAGATLLVVAPETARLGPAAGPARLVVESLRSASSDGAVPLPVCPGAGDEAYLIYTSGSTGRPKAAVLTHGGLAHYTASLRHLLEIGETDVYLHTAAFSFSSSVRQLLVPWTAGATVVLATPEELEDPRRLFQRIRDDGVTLVDLVPSYWQTCLDVLDTLPPVERRSLLAHRLRRVLSASEPLPADLPARWYAAAAGESRWTNMFGQTETTGIVATQPIPRDVRAGRGTLPLGRPVRGMAMHVLDPTLSPVAVGVRGEICIGGPTVGGGYLAQPSQTAEVFVPDPEGAPGARLYRTGDLGYRLAEGRVVFAGRRDHQVKVRGFRVELGEIEAVLLEHPAVAEAAVVARTGDDGGTRLCAYVVLRPGAAVADGELRVALAQRLPSYSIPVAWSVLEALPRTTSGKLDRRALPTVEPLAENVRSRAPRNPVEEILADLWAEVLDLPRVAVDDDFFELGGHSLLATRLVARIHRSLGVEIPLRAVFESPTVAQLALQLETAGRSTTPDLPPLPHPSEATGDERAEPGPLSFAQERLWFLDRMAPEDPSYNLAYFVDMKGRLTVAALAAALDGVERRHRVMRTTFGERGGRPVQRVEPAVGRSLPLIDLASLPGPRLEPEAGRLADGEARRGFDLENGPLVRRTLLRRGAADHTLLWTLHHVVSDAWSRGVLVREVAHLYAAFSRGLAPSLPPLPLQYTDYAAWQRRWLQGERLERLIAFWRQALNGAVRPLELPVDRPRSAVRSTRGDFVPVALPPSLVDRVRGLGRSSGATLFMVLLAAFQTVLGRHSGQRRVTVATPVAGRLRPELESLVGFFVNTLPLQADLSTASSFRELLEQVRETALAAYAHQEVPFEHLVEVLEPDRDPSRPPLAQVSLVLQNAPQPPLELEGLRLTAVSRSTGTAKLELTLALEEWEGCVARGDRVRVGAVRPDDGGASGGALDAGVGVVDVECAPSSGGAGSAERGGAPSGDGGVAVGPRGSVVGAGRWTVLSRRRRRRARGRWRCRGRRSRGTSGS